MRTPVFGRWVTAVSAFALAGAIAGIVAIVLANDSFAQTPSRFLNRGQRSKPTKIDSSELKNHNVVREDGKNVVYKRRNVVDFDDMLLEGEVKNPSEFYFVHRPEEKFGSLVKKRKNFHKEMLRDTVMIR